jgi:hypothetical protein
VVKRDRNLTTNTSIVSEVDKDLVCTFSLVYGTDLCGCGLIFSFLFLFLFVILHFIDSIYLIPFCPQNNLLIKPDRW